MYFYHNGFALSIPIICLQVESSNLDNTPGCERKAVVIRLIHQIREQIIWQCLAWLRKITTEGRRTDRDDSTGDLGGRHISWE
ncbi:MAG: hypothetical protein C3F12_01255 [Candidatus Methylomirabilota bacterium]|nr:MAG: hypothetical protein C3F12_01255 [candidate division NC10 bacterium]